MRFRDWEADQLKKPEFVEALNKLRGKRVQIDIGVDTDQPALFIHKLHSKGGKFVVFVFWFLIFYLCVEIRYHKKGETPWLKIE
jgi:hypothetical protein